MALVILWKIGLEFWCTDCFSGPDPLHLEVCSDLGLAGRWERIFPTGQQIRGGFFQWAGKKEMSDKTPRPGYIKSKMKNIARQSGPINLLLIIIIIIIIITEWVSQSASNLLFS